jgi:hypothetical protein
MRGDLVVAWRACRVVYELDGLALDGNLDFYTVGRSIGALVKSSVEIGDALVVVNITHSGVTFIPCRDILHRH